MNEFRADLHCHTSCSDGTVSPKEIIQLALDLKLQGLSITDHDTIAAYTEAAPLAKEKNISLLSGVELSAFHKQSSVHILAYCFALNNLNIENFCQRHQKRREERNQQIFSLLTSHGMPMTFKDLPPELLFPGSKHSIGRPHIAIAMLKKGYVQTIQQAFHQYLGEGKSCYVPSSTFTVEETLEIIHSAKGLAIIAHPHLIENMGVLNDLLKMDFDGIEGYYARFPLSEQERWVKIGARKGWIITGGSDFHGSLKPNISLGQSWVNEQTFNTLYQIFQRNQNSSL